MNLDNELDAFTQIVTGADTQTRLLLVTGDGGMGKSYLLRLYQRVADDNSLPLIFFDLREQISVEKCFHQIINGFGYDHFPCCDAFLTDKPHQPFLPSQEESWQRSLTRYFFTDLRRYTAPPRPAVILFDQYESADSMLKEWLHKLFLPRLSAHHIIVVIAGREPFYPPPSSQGSRHFPLTGVTVDWYQKYVDAYNIPLDPRHTVLLHEALKGQPKLFIEFVKNRYRTLSQYA